MLLYALVFAAIDLKILFKGMRIRYGKLTSKKSGGGQGIHRQGLLDPEVLQFPG